MQKLFSDFPEVTAEQWKEQIKKDLKGIDFSSLIWSANSGINIQPFYTKENLPPNPTSIFTTNEWFICENITVKDAQSANKQALNALENGASGIVFEISTKVNYSELLKNISIQHIYVLFKASSETFSEIETYLKTIEKGENCFVEFDDTLNGNIKLHSTHELCINTCLYQEAGSNTVNELSFSLAHLNEYLNQTTEIHKIHINVSVGGDFFNEIAKLKALRKLINFLLTQYQIKAIVHIHAQTTLINKGSIDSYNNMLRTTTEAMSASIGGANSILVLPFDYNFNEPSEFSSRMARNQQLILKEESYLNKVADISAGSYYLESLTETLCEKAWEQFKVIESKGGLTACLKSNYIQELIRKDSEILIKQFQEGQIILVGINKFQNKNESNISPINVRYKHPCGINSINLNELQVQQAVN